MKSLYFAFIIIFCSSSTFSQTVAPFLEWVKGYEYSGSASPSSMATDVDGNIYVTGSFDDSLIVNNEIFDTYEFEIFENNDGFIMKLDKFGELIWFKHIMSNSESGYITYQSAGTVIVDHNKDLIITGSFFSSFKIDGVPESAISSSNGQDDGYILKLSADGDFIWVKRIGGNSGDSVGRVAVDSENNIHVIGSFNSTVDFDPAPGNNNVENLVGLGAPGGNFALYNDAFLLKLNSNGEFIWVRHFAGTELITANTIVIDDNDDVIVSGIFFGTCHFVGVNGAFLYAYHEVYYDKYVAKLNKNGEFLWIKEVNATNTGGVSVASTFVDADGAIYTTGAVRGTVDLDSGSDDFFLSASYGSDVYIDKIDSDGNLVWAKSFPGIGWAELGACVWLDVDNDIYISGRFRDSVDFDAGPGEVFLSPLNFESMFLLKLNNDGEFNWVKKTEGYSSAGPIIIDSNKDILFFGGYYTSVEFNDFDSDTTLNKERGMYLMKLKQSEDTECCDSDEIVYYPNPTSDFVYFETNITLFIKVSDLRGKMIKEEKTNTISLVDVSSGVYFLSLYDDENEFIKTIKIIKY